MAETNKNFGEQPSDEGVSDEPTLEVAVFLDQEDNSVLPEGRSSDWFKIQSVLMTMIGMPSSFLQYVYNDDACHFNHKADDGTANNRRSLATPTERAQQQ